MNFVAQQKDLLEKAYYVSLVVFICYIINVELKVCPVLKRW